MAGLMFHFTKTGTMSNRCLALDFDGVLADSPRLKNNLIQTISSDYLSESNFQKVIQYLKVNSGVTRQQKFEFCQSLDPSFPLREALQRLGDALLHLEIVYEDISPFLLEYLNQFNVYIVSSAPLVDIQKWQLRCSYQLVQPSSIYHSVSDKSLVLRQIRTNLLPHTSSFTYIGDTFSDYKSAISAGWSFVAVTQYSVEDWKPVLNTLKITKLSELNSILF